MHAVIGSKSTSQGNRLAPEIGAASRALPPKSYVDAAQFALEQERLFRRAWIPVVRSNDIPGRGAYVTTVIGGEPIVVMRGPDGKVGAMSNVCRHRSMVMLEGAGTVASIRCPYHRWTYALDGALKGAPFMPREILDDPSCGLPRYATEEWMGWVFVTLAGERQPVAEQFAELAAKLPADLPDWVTVASVPFTSPFNWKIIVENASESYHNIGSHTATLQPRWPGGDSRPVETNGNYLEVHHSEDPDAGTFVAYTLFPFTSFTIQRPDPSVLWYDLRVDGVADCQMTLRLLMPPGRAADRKHVERMTAAITGIHQEDIVACGKVQAGVGAPSAVAGPLSPLEGSLEIFHRWLERQLATEHQSESNAALG